MEILTEQKVWELAKESQKDNSLSDEQKEEIFTIYMHILELIKNKEVLTLKEDGIIQLYPKTMH